MYGGGSDHVIAIVGRDDLRHEISSARQRLTDSIEVLYVHTTIKVEGGTEGVEREGGGQRGEGNGVFFIRFLDFYP